MKIWVVCVGEPVPEENNKTRLRRMGNFCKKLSENKENEVNWLSSTFDHYQKKQLAKQNCVVKLFDNYKLHMIFSKGYKKNISYSRIRFHKDTAKKMYTYMKVLENPDVILTSMEPLEIAESAVRYGMENNIPVIVDVRDLWPEIYYEVFPKFMHLALMPYVKLNQRKLKKIMNNAYAIFGLSNSFLQYGLRYANREVKDTDDVIPIAYPNYNYEAANINFKEEWEPFGLKEEDFLVVFLGNFGDQFKFTEIIESSQRLYKKYPKIKFVLCGTGKHLDKVKEQTNDNVIFPGWIYQKEIMTLLSNAHIGIAPYIDSQNYRNNTPNKFGEYLSASLPILVSVSGDMEKLLSERQCGFYYKNASELEEYILRLYNDKLLLSEQSHNARILYEDMFESNIVYDKMISKLKIVCKHYKEDR